jgi:glycosyltransferase involved in cell wall biosynthesis
MSLPSIAIVYDRMNTPYGGAEQVLMALHQAFPDAPFFTSVYDKQKANWADRFIVKPSFLQKIPGAVNHHRLFAPLMPLAFESFDLDEFDVVISITSAEAKGVITKPHQLHICYMLTPTRYLYSHRQEYEQSHWPFKVPIINVLSKKLFDYLHWWDTAAASRPDVIIPISKIVQKRVEQFYGRHTSEVLYPPLQLNEDQKASKPKIDLPNEFLLVISRLVPYKRIDVAIQAAKLTNKNIVVVGQGPITSELKSLSNTNTTFINSVTEVEKRWLLEHAQALLMPGLEDFGITAVEAALSGTPVILHTDSGAAELLDKNTAVFLNEANSKEVAAAIKKVGQIKFDKLSYKKKLEKYAINNFVTRFQETVVKEWKSHQKGRYERS